MYFDTAAAVFLTAFCQLWQTILKSRSCIDDDEISSLYILYCYRHLLFYLFVVFSPILYTFRRHKILRQPWHNVKLLIYLCLHCNVLTTANISFNKLYFCRVCCLLFCALRASTCTAAHLSARYCLLQFFILHVLLFTVSYFKLLFIINTRLCLSFY